MEKISELLRAEPATATWLEHLETIGDPAFEVMLPAADDLPAILLDLAVPHDDIDDLVAMLPTYLQADDMAWLLRRSVHSLVREIGSPDPPLWFPALPASLGLPHRYFYVYVFLAALPYARAYHRERGIPDEVSRRTLADLGRNMAVHRRRYGVGGLDTAFWLMLHFRGAIYDMGRLQFQRARLGTSTGEAIRATGAPYGPGDPVLAVHIPAFSGPMSPSACDRSFERAREFFARHYPEETYRVATCHSWILDDQLAEYLPEESNIIRFQRRFQIAHQRGATDDDIVRFVFGRVNPVLAELPRRTRLERAVLDHIASGRHWHGGAGWLPL